MKRIIISVLAGILLTAFIMFIVGVILLYTPAWFRSILFSTLSATFISMIVYDILKSKESKEKRKPKAVENSVVVYICGKLMYLDLENLKDEEFAMRDRDGQYDFPCGHYFNADNAVKAAEKAGKRLLTPEEWGEIKNLPSRWDDEKKGRWFTFNIPSGTVDVFFEACGFISAIDKKLYDVGSVGRYWSASPYSSSSNSASYLYFDPSPTSLNVHSNGTRSNGFSVRCVREL